jgi:predicted Zn finger-like uncharacterized protein
MIRAFSKSDSMRIACPSCTATYEVPAARLKPGKLVRCARCSAEWLPADESDPLTRPWESTGYAEGEAAEQSPPLPEPDTAASLARPTAMDWLAASSRRAKPHAGLIGAWVLTVVVLAAAIGAVIGWRDAIVRAWPPSGYILAATGHATPLPAQAPGKNAE